MTTPLFASCEKFQLYPRIGGHERMAPCRKRLIIENLTNIRAAWEILVRNEDLQLV